MLRMIDTSFHYLYSIICDINSINQQSTDSTVELRFIAGNYEENTGIINRVSKQLKKKTNKSDKKFLTLTS